MVRFKMIIFTKLHLVVDTNTNSGVFFLSRFLNLHWTTISFNHIVDNLKKFQELPQQSMINEFLPIYKLVLVDPATIAGEKGPFWQLEG